MVWAVDAVRMGEAERVKGRFQFPREAVGAKPGEQHFVAPWALETLVNEALVRHSAAADARRLLNTKLWASFATIFNLLSEIEDRESMDDIPELGILDALPRIGWRQFGWQIGYKTCDRLYRAWSLYNFREANEFFLKTYGVSVDRFCYVGFVVAALLNEFPAVDQDASLSKVGITDAERNAFFRMVSLPSTEARKRARAERAGKGQIAYKPSVLRRTPLIMIQNGSAPEAFCPITELLYRRITDGLFYDLIGDDNLRRIIGERFEDYVFQITNYYLSKKFQLLPESRYGPKSQQRATPDLRILNEKDELRAVVECKSRRIPFKVLSSPNPYLENEDIYDELVKGVIQIWTYVAEVRLGVADRNWIVSADVVGVVLTLEPWLQMHAQTIEAIRKRAALRIEENTNIEEIDQIEIAFVSMDEWEYALRRIDADGFLQALNDQASPRRHGFLLSSTVGEIIGRDNPSVTPFDYHDGISRLVSWWNDVRRNVVPEPPEHG